MRHSLSISEKVYFSPFGIGYSFGDSPGTKGPMMLSLVTKESFVSWERIEKGTESTVFVKV